MPSNPFCEEIASKFAWAIQHGRISKAQAARNLKVSRQMLYEYLKGRSLPKHSVLQRACTVWGLELNYKGVILTAGSFRQPVVDTTTAPRPEQLNLNLREALDQLNDEDLGIRILRKENGRIELQVEVKFAR